VPRQQEGPGYPSGVSRSFAMLQRRVGGRLASLPSPPLSWHQTTHLLAPKRAIKALVRRLTTLNGPNVRLGSPQSGRGSPSVPAGRWRYPRPAVLAPSGWGCASVRIAPTVATYYVFGSQCGGIRIQEVLLCIRGSAIVPTILFSLSRAPKRCLPAYTRAFLEWTMRCLS
jgi:hypothetical protein